jgi:Asp-tRNA(Asn)/Glu-tRNA(Gln) amidotransferase A subunit family amidase
LGAGASVLGLGSDVAGSLRIPAHFSGCYALKPSSGRWPTGGNTMGLNGQEAIVTVFGPMARNVQDLCLAMQVVSNSRPWLRYRECLPLPLVCCADENIPPKQQQQQLKFGYYLSDGFLEPTSPCRRAVQVVVDRLEAAGHKCIPFDIRQAMDPVEMIQIFYGLVGADGCRSVRKTLGSDPLDPAISQLLAVMNLPRSIKRLAGRILRAISQPKAAAVLTAFDGSSVQELWQLQYRRQKFCERFHKYFMESGVDLLICPVNVHPAIPHGTFKTCPLLLVIRCFIIYWIMRSACCRLPKFANKITMQSYRVLFGKHYAQVIAC